MLKTIALVIAGLAAGFAVAYWTKESPTFADAPASNPGVDGSASRAAAGNVPARIAELENALDAEIEQRAALEQRVVELGAALDELRGGAGERGANGDRPVERQVRAVIAVQEGTPPLRNGPPGMRGSRGAETLEQRVGRLVDAGFPPDRAAWIERRTSELAMQTIQAQYQQRRGETVDPALFGGQQTLRQELGDADYERYLAALGRSTKVGVFNVIPSSPAEQAGLRAGDEILTYGGARVFDMRELNDLTVAGTPGEPVVLEVQRDGQNLQLVLPRGPIGIGGGPFNRRP
jgi:hypothetical protein